jgi:3-deoxy-manno-octulosonate cytidylyltransferase (CMP-KDO synthetase)
MIEHVYRRAAEAASVSRVIVAADDARVFGVVKGFGGEVVMTSDAHRTGTERVAEVARSLNCDIVVNVQGDEPLVTGAMIDAAVASCRASADVPMATLRRRFRADEDPGNPHIVKVVVDQCGRALYFSRSPVPFAAVGRSTSCFKHIGLYAYRRTFLLTLAELPPTPLERAESLEQMRALEHGFPIATAESPHDSTGVDTADDLERVRAQLEADARVGQRALA